MKTMKETLKSSLKTLTGLYGGSGQEQAVIQHIVQELKDYNDQMTVDPKGNIYVKIIGKHPGPKRMFTAHTDEIGLVVRNILPNGFLVVDRVGGVPDNLLPGRAVFVGPKHIPGVTGNKPGHLQTEEEASRVTPVASIYVDVAMSSREEVEQAGIKIGDFVIWQQQWNEMHNPDFIATKAVDDRICCAILMELVKHIDPEHMYGTLEAVFTVQEEVGLYGAKTAMHRVAPDLAIALDTIPCGDTPDVLFQEELPIQLDHGPGFPVADAVGDRFFSMIHPALRKAIETCAQEKEIHLQTVTLMGGNYTTDAAALMHEFGGVPSATLAVPRRYSHSPVELFSLNDAVDVYELALALCYYEFPEQLSFLSE